MKELEKFVSKLNEKVMEKKGEIVFCLREFQFGGRNDVCFSGGTEVAYYETGIINGDLIKYDKKNVQYETINFPAISLEHQPLDKLILGEYSIPVNKKFKGFFMHDFHKSFQFEIKELEEQLKQGQLYMNQAEFAKAFSFQGIFYPGSEDEYLKNFYFLIGDKETENFVKEKEIDNYQGLFNILKKPEYVKQIIDKYYSDEREKIGKKLTITANEIANNFREIKSLETGVMNVHLTEDWDADGRKIKIWNKEGLVNKYYRLKKEISNQIGNRLNKYLEKGSVLNQKGFLGSGGMGMISGEIIGFPEEVTFGLYSNWLQKVFLSNINKTFEKIDNYLMEKNEKAIVQ